MSLLDTLLAPFYLILVLLFAYKYKAKHQHEHPAYKYFIPGLLAKIVGAIGLGLVYYFYYGGGDTVNYFTTASAFVDLFLRDKSDFIHVYFGQPFFSEIFLLKGDHDFGGGEEFVYWINDPYAFFVAKCFFPVVLIACKSYMSSAILVASICYIAVWKLYMVFVEEIPELYKQFAFCILFVPSVTFWGSGIMKDSLSFSSACLYVHGFYWLVIRKKYSVWNVTYIIIAAFMLLSIKPYILFALLPGSIVWFVALKVVNIKNALIKIAIAPAIIVIGGALAFTLMSNLGDKLGKYSIDKVFDTAHGAQQDLKQSYYQGNTFDIGDYEPTITGLLSVSHKATFAALFRPTLFDVRNIVMLFSALENAFLLIFCLYLLVKLKFYKFFILVQEHPLALFSMIFALFFALSVGVSISNFGTLVRLKIPSIPFFVSSLVIVNHLMIMKKRVPEMSPA
jgi:hypothetical protein